MARYVPNRPDSPVDDEAYLWESITASLGTETLARVKAIMAAPELDVGQDDLDALNFDSDEQFD
jgi:hypothetical protein